MADSASITAVKDSITPRLQAMLDRARTGQSFLIRVIYPMYKQMQLTRWQTENASEGNSWTPISASYAARKKRMYGGGNKYRYYPSLGLTRPIGKYPSYPGEGTKTMIATGRLFGAAFGPGSGMPEGESFHRVRVTDTSLTISLNANKKKTEYFKHANEARPITQFGPVSRALFKAKVKEYFAATRRTF